MGPALCPGRARRRPLRDRALPRRRRRGRGLRSRGPRARRPRGAQGAAPRGERRPAPLRALPPRDPAGAEGHPSERLPPPRRRPPRPRRDPGVVGRPARRDAPGDPRRGLLPHHGAARRRDAGDAPGERRAPGAGRGVADPAPDRRRPRRRAHRRRHPPRSEVRQRHARAARARRRARRGDGLRPGARGRLHGRARVERRDALGHHPRHALVHGTRAGRGRRDHGRRRRLRVRGDDVRDGDRRAAVPRRFGALDRHGAPQAGTTVAAHLQSRARGAMGARHRRLHGAARRRPAGVRRRRGRGAREREHRPPAPRASSARAGFRARARRDAPCLHRGDLDLARARESADAADCGAAGGSRPGAAGGRSARLQEHLGEQERGLAVHGLRGNVERRNRGRRARTHGAGRDRGPRQGRAQAARRRRPRAGHAQAAARESRQ